MLNINVVIASEKCENIFEQISDRFFDLNKRIEKAQKSVKEYETRVESKSRFLYYSNVENIYDEPTGIS